MLQYFFIKNSCAVQAVLSLLSCPSSHSCLILAALSWQPCPGSPVLVVLSWVSFLAVLHGSPALAALSWQSYIFWHFCPGIGGIGVRGGWGMPGRRGGGGLRVRKYECEKQGVWSVKVKVQNLRSKRERKIVCTRRFRPREKTLRPKNACPSLTVIL
jgi:hypothetical protein